MSTACARVTNSPGTVQYYSSQTTVGGASTSVSTTTSGTPVTPSLSQPIAASASYEETLEHIKQTHTHMMNFFNVWQQRGCDVVSAEPVIQDGEAVAEVVEEEDDFDGLEIDLPGGNPNEDNDQRVKGNKDGRK